MSTATIARRPATAVTLGVDYLLLMREIEDFLYVEAATLDQRHWEEWLTFFHDDLKYWMPLRKNLAFRDRDHELSTEQEIAWFDNDKDLLTRRVTQLMSGIHWAEEPLSRISHLLTNIRMVKPVKAVAEGESIEVHCQFLIYRNRLEQEVDFLVGRREDTLVRTDGSFLIKTRKVVLDQNVLTAKNISFFF
jgi:3-phenylpropionate/cinnamic acid dioxygenase small subunit